MENTQVGYLATKRSAAPVSFYDLTMVDPPEPTDWDDEPTTPYWPAKVAARPQWRVTQGPGVLRVERF